MGSKQKTITSITYKGRSFGIIALTAAQLLIGFIHAVTGLGLLVASPTTLAYNSYTIVFGLLTLASGVLIWQAKKTGWIVTVASLLFVTVADSLAVANLPTIPGIPTFAAPTEIGYSVIVIIYLLQPKVRRKLTNQNLNPATKKQPKTQTPQNEGYPILQQTALAKKT